MTAICGILNIHIFVVDRKQKNKFTNSMCFFVAFVFSPFTKKSWGSLSLLAYVTVCTVQQFDRTNMKNQYIFFESRWQFFSS